MKKVLEIDFEEAVDEWIRSRYEVVVDWQKEKLIQRRGEAYLFIYADSSDVYGDPLDVYKFFEECSVEELEE